MRSNAGVSVSRGALAASSRSMAGTVARLSRACQARAVAAVLTRSTLAAGLDSYRPHRLAPWAQRQIARLTDTAASGEEELSESVRTPEQLAAMARLRSGMVVKLLRQYEMAAGPPIPPGAIGHVLAVPPNPLTVHFDGYMAVLAKPEDLEPVGRIENLAYQAQHVRFSPAAGLGFLTFVGIVPALVGVVLAHLFHVWFGW